MTALSVLSHRPLRKSVGGLSWLVHPIYPGSMRLRWSTARSRCILNYFESAYGKYGVIVLSVPRRRSLPKSPSILSWMRLILLGLPHHRSSRTALKGCARSVEVLRTRVTVNLRCVPFPHRLGMYRGVFSVRASFALHEACGRIQTLVFSSASGVMPCRLCYTRYLCARYRPGRFENTGAAHCESRRADVSEAWA